MYFKPASPGPFSVTGVIHKIDRNGKIIDTSMPAVFSGNASYLAKPEYKQDKTAITAITDSISIDFNRAYDAEMNEKALIRNYVA